MKYIIVLIFCLYSCTGPMGPAGPQGEMGEPGVAGEDGRDGMDGEDVSSLTLWLGCSKSMDLLGNDVTEETYLTYNAVLFSNGDMQVTCAASLGASQDDFSYVYFPGITKGASSGACAASSDYPPFGDGIAGYWGFDLKTGYPTATYSDDVAHPMYGDAFVFSNDDCYVYSTNKDGSWSDSSLPVEL